MPETADTAALRELTTTVVTAYVSNHHLPPGDVRSLIGTVYKALSGLTAGTPTPNVETARERPTPAEIRRSIAPDHLISFVDGRAYKTLKRHLRGHNLTPEAYRAKFGLPVDYPMTAPGYSARRSELAKSLRFGTRSATPAAD